MRQMNVRSLFNPKQSTRLLLVYTIRQLPEMIPVSAGFHWAGQTCWFQVAPDWPILVNPLAVRGCGSERVAAEG